jgi:NAD(P)-dependent dehydrogenase (short-subunit alcohol dehydrogenase family)
LVAPDEVADAVALLSSAEASAITGVVLLELGFSIHLETEKEVGQIYPVAN